MQSSKQVESKQIAKLKERVKKLTAAIEAAKKGGSVDFSVLQDATEEAGGLPEDLALTPRPEGVEDDKDFEEPEDITF